MNVWLFRQRKYLPVPFVLLGLWSIWRRGHPLRAGTPARVLLDLVAWLLIFAGETLRVWGVGHIGRKSRSSDIHAAHLVTSGPYAYTRNPLYLGGFFLTLGLAILTGALWAVIGCLAYWLVVYSPIIRAEEAFLRQQFGSVYEAYCRAVPQWWPRVRPWPDAASSAWRRAELSKEYQTFLAICCTVVLINASLMSSEWFNLQQTRQLASTSARYPVVAEQSTEGSGGAVPTPIPVASATRTITLASLAQGGGAGQGVLPIHRPISRRIASWLKRQLPGVVSGALAFTGTYMASDPTAIGEEEFEEQLPTIASATFIALAVHSLVAHATAPATAFDPQRPDGAWTLSPYVERDHEDWQLGVLVRLRF